MDVAASEFYGEDKTYDLNFKEEASYNSPVCSLSCVRRVTPYVCSFSFLTSMVLSLQNNNGKDKISGDQLKDLYKSFVAEYPIVSIEDPFDQDDWEHYGKMTAECGTQVQIVGDDLLVTNPKVIGNLICSLCSILLLVQGIHENLNFKFLLCGLLTSAESWEGNQGEEL